MTKITQETVDEITQELTVPQQTGVVGYTAGEADVSDFAIPYVTLVQASSDAVKNRTAQAGDFLSTDGETFESVECVPLHIRYVRDFYDKTAQKNICGSQDRVTGYPADFDYFRDTGGIDLEEGPLACKDCPFYEWQPQVRMGCMKGYVVTMYDIQREQPFMVRVRGTAVRPFRDRFVGAVTMGRAKPWARAFRMESKLAKSAANSWFVPELTPIKGHSDEEQAGWEAYAAGFGAPQGAEVSHDDLPFE